MTPWVLAILCLPVLSLVSRLLGWAGAKILTPIPTLPLQHFSFHSPLRQQKSHSIPPNTHHITRTHTHTLSSSRQCRRLSLSSNSPLGDVHFLCSLPARPAHENFNSTTTQSSRLRVAHLPARKTAIEQTSGLTC
ncbi:hypothetical protein K504DRAFT_301054 [Pleomassaria siparia CBS 279.74]|uniref:Secreted protein n=1 Tax=Pleomassaria siparia CBS 279.74 TaxID=1314801 RepID=A0A6G1K747_9PLEO|nr:hypothetical protein K504DRAFT_301054 [Pleomassaria siparia CBS 279.74]